MNSPTENRKNATLPLAIQPTQEATLTYFPALALDEKAFVAAYVENAYSLPEACAALKMSQTVAGKMLRNVTIRRAISEVQQELDGIDFLNTAWVKAQLLKLYPMVIGEEPIPYITSSGEQAEGRKFDAGTAMRIIEYVAPKTQRQEVNINISNINKLSDEQLEQIASRGNARVIEHEE